MSLVRRVLIDRSRPPPQILSAFDPDGDVCGLCSILIATSARTCEGRPPQYALRAAFVRRRTFGSARQSNQVAGISLIFPAFRADRTPRSRLASVPRTAAANLLAIPRATREDDRALMLKSMSTADSRPKGAAVPVAHARQVKSLSDRDACVSHPRRLQQL